MDLASQERPSDSALIERIWYSRSQSAVDFYSMADVHSELVITRWRGQTRLTIRGPETRATLACTLPGAEHIGIQFNPGVYMPRFPPSRVIDRGDVELPAASTRSFWLDGAAWEFPTYENADTFVDRLVRAGYLVRDPLIADVLRQKPVDASLRTVQRRFLRATGLTQDTIYQIERARYAVGLLLRGVSILDTVEESGYFDQPHLTRVLKRMVGFTPAQIARGDPPERLSFLYNTSPVQEFILSKQGQPPAAVASPMGLSFA